MEVLILVPFAGFVLLWKRWQSGTVAGAALHAISFLLVALFLGGLAGFLPQMRILLLASGTLALLFVLITSGREGLRDVSSVPLLLLIALCALFFVLHGSSHFRFYDEYSHWGIFLREMVANGGFWGADTNSLHPRYPPGPTLWQYFFVYSDVPRDGAAYFAQFVLLLVPLLILFESLQWKQIGWILGIIGLLLFGLANFGHGITSLYVDHVLAAWVAGILLNFLAESADRRPGALLWYVLPLSALALIKDVGFFFALGLAAVMAAIHVVRDGHLFRGAHRRRLLLPAFFLAAWIAGPLLVTASWSHNREALAAPEDVMSVRGLTGILTGEVSQDDPERARAVSKRFAEVFLKQQLSKNRTSDRFNEFSYDQMSLYQDRFRLTTVSFFALFIVWSALLLIFLLPRSSRPGWTIALVGLLGIACGYTVMLYLSYQVVFPRDDGMSVASYIRYMHSVVLPMLLVGMAPLLPVFAAAEEREMTFAGFPRSGVMAACFASMLFALVLLERPRVVQMLTSTPPPEFRAEIRPLTAKVRSIVGRNRLWAYFPDPNPHKVLSRVMLFELTPTPSKVHADPAFFDLTEDRILSEFAGFDYVWITVQDDEVEDRLRSLTGDDSGARLLRVERGGSRIRLLPVL